MCSLAQFHLAPAVRAAAVRAIARGFGVKHISGLSEISQKDPDESVREAAKSGLKLLGYQFPPPPSCVAAPQPPPLPAHPKQTTQPLPAAAMPIVPAVASAAAASGSLQATAKAPPCP